MRSLLSTSLALATALLIGLPVFASILEGGTGLSYGSNHSYFLTAPEGWILDTESGAEQGVYATFYPKGSDWNGPAVMYSNAAGREGRSGAEAIEHDAEFLKEKSPQLKVVDGGTITTKDKKEAVVRYFSGDKHGNYEACAYVVEKNVVANIVLTARNKAEYDKGLPAFRKLVASYRYISDEPGKLNLQSIAKEEHDKASPQTAEPVSK